jgi:type II secretory pathway pseudopilin PulG
MTEPEPEPERRTIAPFLGAFAIVVLVVIGIVVFNVMGSDARTPEQDVGQAVAAQNAALQRANYADFRAVTCVAQQGKETEVLERQRNSVAQKGERYVDRIGATTVNGDQATANVTYYFDKARDDKISVDLNLVREDGAWKVCSPSPS